MRVAAVAAALAVLAVCAPGGAAAADGSFRVAFDPPLSGYEAQGNPDSPHTPLAIEVTAVGSDGRPLRDAVIDMTLTAPDPSALAGSDVPRIEGRRLVHLRLGAPEGRAGFEAVMPIRGTYDLDLAARPAPGSEGAFQPFGERRGVEVDERSGELARFIVLLVALFAFGLVAAVVLTRSQLARRRRMVAAPGGGRRPVPASRTASAAGALLALLIVGITAILVVDTVQEADHDEEALSHQGPGRGERVTASQGPYELRYSLSRSSEDGIGTATLVGIRGSVVDTRSGERVAGAAFRLEAIDSETGEPAVAAETTSPDGTFVWDNDFWDGIPHDVRVTASPGDSGASFTPIEGSTELDVQAISPPVGRKLLVLLLMMLAVGLGMVAGVVAARRRWRPARPGRGPADPAGVAEATR